jgi:hypothetical protein
VITGRGPGAPGVTLGLDFTRRPAAAGGTGGRAVDLSEIRRSEEAINVLAARGATGPELTHDPALVLLSALVADVDTPGAVRESGVPRPGVPGPGLLRSGLPGPGVLGPGTPGPGDLQRDRARAGWPGRAAGQRAEAWQALASAPSRGVAAWLRAAVAGGVVAGLASITSLIATSMLARLTRGPARGGRWQPRHVRPRRVR